MSRMIILLIALLIGFTASASEARLSLTASDGSGLVLTRLKARVVLEGFLAFTELELVFYNPEDRRREGRFQMVLPEGAAISRFAMEVAGYLQEGEVVETALARRAYEDFLHRRQDPALLESDSANRFNARIFPIEANEHKRLIIAYSQRLLEGDYVLPLLGLPQLGELEVRLYHDGMVGETRELGGFSATTQQREVLTISETDFLPSADFRIPRVLVDGLTLRGEDWLAARLVPLSNSNPAPLEDLLVLVDTSASQALHLDDSVARLGALLEQLSPSSLRLIAFDQQVVDLGTAREPAARQALLEQLASRPALGASRLDAVLDWLATEELGNSRVLLISDMVLTAGESSAVALKQRLARLSSVSRLDILLPGYHQDRSLAEQLSRATPDAGIVARMDSETADLLAKLTRDLSVDLAVTVSDAEWFWPETIPALQAGQAVLVFARLSPGSSPQIRVAGELQSLQEQPVEPLLLHRETVRGRLDKLLAMEADSGDADLRRALHREIIDLSVRERVLSPYTSLLVLETEADYARYGIDRRGLTGILTVGADGLEVMQREGRQGRVQPPPVALPQMSDAVRQIPLAEGAAAEELRDSADERLSPQSMADAAMSEVPTRVWEREAPLATLPPGPMVAEPALMSMPPEPSLQQVVPEQANPAQTQLPGPRNAVTESASNALPEVASPPVAPWSGRYADFRLLLRSDAGAALVDAQAWRDAEPAELLALVALGEAAAELGDRNLAARAYGSLIDYFPGRADIRRWAAERLLALGASHWLAVDSLQKALADRPDHPSAHLLLALAHWQSGEHRQAVVVLDEALEQEFGRFAAAQQILRETRDLLLSVLADTRRVEKLFPARESNWQRQPLADLRFLLVWETDANDVDLHVYDGQGNHAYYQQMTLASGGQLYADITTGYGPEAFRVVRPAAYPYRLAADYYNRGPMGYGMGAMLVLDYRPGEPLKLDVRPFVVMNDKAMVDLGIVAH